MTKSTWTLITGCILAGGLSLFTAGCYYDSKEELGLLNPPCDTAAVSFSTAIVPILDAECMLCHSTANADALGGGNNLYGYANVMNFVEPNDPNASILYQSVAWIPGTSAMPKGGSQLGSCELALIPNWITQGAQDN